MSTLGETAEKLNVLKQEKTKLNAKIEKELNPKIKELEYELEVGLKEVGLEKFSTKTVAITMTSSFVPAIEDWDAFYDYIVKNNAPYLLQRRPSAGPLQEIWGSGQKIDGVEKVSKTTIRTKKL